MDNIHLRLSNVRLSWVAASLGLLFLVASGIGTHSAKAASANLPASPPPLPPVYPLVPCKQAVDPQVLDASEAPCVNDDVLHDSNERILAAKTNAANAYADVLSGRGTAQQLQDAEDWLITVTGEGTVQKRGSTVATNAPTGNAGLPLVGADLKANFFPFEQLTSYYCGAASVQSILYYLGPHRSWAVDPLTNGHDVLKGDSQHDQPMLANQFWLAAEQNDGTNWGERYVPFALNSWRGSRWYVEAATPLMEAGTLTQDQALRDIRYDTDRGYPVAENVLYSPSTYYPAGFMPGIRYQHWDTIYGLSMADGKQYVNIGQVYHDQRTPYQRWQQVEWDVHWSAIGGWHGIVW